jgi:hypothetical protein
LVVWGRSVGTVQVTVEDTGQAGGAQEDEGVGVREKPGGNRSGQGLSRLCVVVLNKGLGIVSDWADGLEATRLGMWAWWGQRK